MYTLKRHARGLKTVIQVLSWLRQVDPWGSKTSQSNWINEPQVTVRVFVSGIPRWMITVRESLCLKNTKLDESWGRTHEGKLLSDLQIYIPTHTHLHFIITHTHTLTHKVPPDTSAHISLSKENNVFVMHLFPTLNSSSMYIFISEVSCRQHTIVLYFYFLYI